MRKWKGKMDTKKTYLPSRFMLTLTFQDISSEIIELLSTIAQPFSKPYPVLPPKAGTREQVCTTSTQKENSCSTIGYHSHLITQAGKVSL